MAYQPTGRPPGRPPKPKPPAEAKPDKPAVEVHPPTPGGPFVPPHGLEGTELVLDLLCKQCFPEGWPGMATGLGCPHGSWTRRL